MRTTALALAFFLALSTAPAADATRPLQKDVVHALRLEDGSLWVDGRLYTPASMGRRAAPRLEEEGGGEPVGTSSAEFWIYAAVCAGLVLLGGTMSGLTVGYCSIDDLKLQLLTEAGDASGDSEQRRSPTRTYREDDMQQRQYAEQVKSVKKNHHLLLVTLLLTNAGAMEALPIFLNKLVPEWLAIVLSVTFVLAFGEVIPQAICTKDPLKIGAKCAPITRFFMFLTYPFSFPIAKLLDCILGEDNHWTYFRRHELKTMIALHDRAQGGNLLIDEVTIMQGALDLKKKTLLDISTDLSDVYMLSKTTKLDQDQIAKILTTGHSRIPIYSGSKKNVKGLLLVKRLAAVDPDDGRPVSQFVGHHMPLVMTKDTNLLDALNKFQQGRSHMAFVVDSDKDRTSLQESMLSDTAVPDRVNVVGIATIEDVIEELIQEDIADEGDISFAVHEYKDDQKAVRKAAAKFKSLLKPKPLREGKTTKATRRGSKRFRMKQIVSQLRRKTMGQPEVGMESKDNIGVNVVGDGNADPEGPTDDLRVGLLEDFRSVNK